MELSQIIKIYQALKLHEVMDYERFYEYAIVHNSCCIAGSELTEIETRLLLEDGTTPKGKLLGHSLMVKDYFDALKYTLLQARERRLLTIEMIKEINYRAVIRTEKAFNGVVNSDTDKQALACIIERMIDVMERSNTVIECLRLSFSAHFDLVSIHPFYDGNGRTSRLLMNYIQQYHRLPLAIVFKEDKADYFEALQQARKQKDTEIFQEFMLGQYKKHLEREIAEYQKMVKAENLKINPGWGKGFSIFF